MPPSLALMGPTVLYSQQIGVWRSFRRQLSISRCAIQFFPNNICWPLQGGLLWFFFSFFSFRGFSTAALLSTPQKAFVKANTQCRKKNHYILLIRIQINWEILSKLCDFLRIYELSQHSDLIFRTYFFKVFIRFGPFSFAFWGKNNGLHAKICSLLGEASIESKSIDIIFDIWCIKKKSNLKSTFFHGLKESPVIMQTLLHFASQIL